MFLQNLLDAQTNAAKLKAVEAVVSTVGRGVHKRIDENRELLQFLQANAPEVLERFFWIEGWIRSQDEFLTELAKAAQIQNPHERRNQNPDLRPYPRPWPELGLTQADLEG